MKLIYTFKQGKAEGDKSMSDVLGGKGANLAEMCNVGLPIPAGLTIPAEACVYYMEYEADDKVKQNALLNDCVKQTKESLIDLTKPDTDDVLPLLSVRSGSRVSMPGMMDTILNVGITVDNLKYWRKQLGDATALDSFRRLIQMFGNVVHGLPSELFEAELDKIKGKKSDAELTVDDLEEVCDEYLALYESFIGTFPFTLDAQLRESIEAVFKSWNCERAIKYRQVHGIPDDWGTAVNVQTMVFGNKNDKSASGVLFSRDPSTGEPGLYGEFLVNAQGEDVVAGIRTPIPLSNMAKLPPSAEGFKLWNDVYSQIESIAGDMEKHYRDMQDMEFTVEDGKLFILQTRSGKRSAAAAFRIAHDMVEEGLLVKEEALKRVTGKQYLVLQKPQIDPAFNVKPEFVGLPAAGNIATGTAVLSSEAAEAFKGKCILVTKETTPEDFGGMVASVGILTMTGGATSHAAVVARGMNKSCVVGCTDLDIAAGDIVTIDGATGRVWVNTEVPVTTAEINEYAKKMIGWAMMNDSGKTMMRVTPEVHSKAASEWSAELATQIPQDGRIYIDCSRLAVCTNRPRFVLAKMIRIVKSRTDLSGIIGLVDSQASGADDAQFLVFLGMMGEKSTAKKESDTGTLQQQLKALLAKNITNKFKKRWTIHLPSFAGKLHVKMVENGGWTQVRRVSNLGDLMEVNGVLDIDDATRQRLADEGVELEKFITLLKQAGRKVDPMPKAVDKDRMIFEVLG